MEIHAITDSAYAVRINGIELENMNISPMHMSENDERGVLRSALELLGRRNCTHVETELYPGKDELLMFIRIGTGITMFFEFDDFENILEATKACTGMPSSLHYIDDKYILSITPWDEEDIPPALFEFGKRRHAADGYAMYITEHSKTLIEKDAVTKLNSIFSARRCY